MPDFGVRPELDTPFVSPRTPFEETVEGIWAETLGLDRVGIHDNFFDLGGNSLVATRVVSKVINQFRLELPLQVVFQSPTVAEMARVIAEHQGNKLGEGELERILREVVALSDEQVQQPVKKSN